MGKGIKDKLINMLLCSLLMVYLMLLSQIIRFKMNLTLLKVVENIDAM